MPPTAKAPIASCAPQADGARTGDEGDSPRGRHERRQGEESRKTTRPKRDSESSGYAGVGAASAITSDAAEKEPYAALEAAPGDPPSHREEDEHPEHLEVHDRNPVCILLNPEPLPPSFLGAVPRRRPTPPARRGRHPRSRPRAADAAIRRAFHVQESQWSSVWIASVSG